MRLLINDNWTCRFTRDIPGENLRAAQVWYTNSVVADAIPRGETR